MTPSSGEGRALQVLSTWRPSPARTSTSRRSFDRPGLTFPDGPDEIAVGYFDTFVEEYHGSNTVRLTAFPLEPCVHAAPS